jgi:hypothetical protein
MINDFYKKKATLRTNKKYDNKLEYFESKLSNLKIKKKVKHSLYNDFDFFENEQIDNYSHYNSLRNGLAIDASFDYQ